jgi:hypothetical protein
VVLITNQGPLQLLAKLLLGFSQYCLPSDKWNPTQKNQQALVLCVYGTLSNAVGSTGAFSVPLKSDDGLGISRV